MKHAIFGAAFLAMTSSATAFAEPLELNVYRTNSESFEIASVLVTGDTEAVLIDAQFANSEAEKVVQMIKDSDKELTAIYVSHSDPDYYFGLDVISKAFPDADILATAETVAAIEASYEGKLDFWGPKLGEDAPAQIIIPTAFSGDTLTVDGEALEIYGKDGDMPEQTHVWIPSIEAVIGGVAVQGDHHVFVADIGTPEARAERIALLESLKALEPEIVIPAHSTPAAPETVEAIQMSIDYLTAYETAVDEADGSEELMATMSEQFPDNGCRLCLELGAKVAEGEMEW